MRLRPPLPVCDDAEFSADGAERLWLSRKVDFEDGPVGLIIGLNPSTAGATDNDQTIRKEKEFARRWRWRGFWKVNLFTRIETYSQNLKNMTLDEAVGAHGDAVLEATIGCALDIVVCWGAAVPKHMRLRVNTVCNKIRRLSPEATVLCFGLTQNGDPVHPLYLSYDTQLVPFEMPAERATRR